MSREIKYRDWDIRKSEMIYDAIVATETHSLLATTLDLQNQFNYFDGLVWMQYLCIKDKNGKEIYEGDIIKTSTGENAHVYYDDTTASFRYGSGQIFEHSEELEVTGNTYQI